MHTHKTLTVLRHGLYKAGVSLKERRLIFGTPEHEDPEATTEGGDRGNERGGALDNERRDLSDRLDTASGGAARGGQETFRDATTPRQRERGRRQTGTESGNERGAEVAAAAEAERERERRENEQRAPAPAPTPTPSSSASASGGTLRSPLDRRRDNPIINAGITSAAVSGSIAAGMKAASLADVPVLGKYASAVGTGLNYVSTGISNALTTVGAPSQLSVLANPWVFGTTLPVLGLWMLGKGRIRWLREYHKHNPNDPKTTEVLAKIKELEDSPFLRRTMGTLNEGAKFIAGIPRNIVKFVPEQLGGMLGNAYAQIGNIGKKLGGLKGVVNWPIKNAKHLVTGGLGAIGGAVGAPALVNAAAVAGGGAAISGVALPAVAAVAGGIAAYRWSKHRKSSSAGADLAPAGT